MVLVAYKVRCQGLGGGRRPFHVPGFGVALRNLIWPLLCPPVFDLSFCQPIFLSISGSNDRSSYMSVSLSLYIYISVCLSVYLSI